MSNHPCDHLKNLSLWAGYRPTNRNPKPMLYFSYLDGFGWGFGLDLLFRNRTRKARFRLTKSKPNPQSETLNPLNYLRGFGFRLEARNIRRERTKEKRHEDV